MNDKQHFENKQKAALSVRKARGAIDKILSQIEEDAYCPEIIQQISAAKGLLDSAKKTLLVGHLDHCLIEKMNEDSPRTTKELLKIFDLQ
jgi:DNA-binding FrmR family transcriptional regulator